LFALDILFLTFSILPPSLVTMLKVIYQYFLFLFHLE
jgi:hypothetical protein